MWELVRSIFIWGFRGVLTMPPRFESVPNAVLHFSELATVRDYQSNRGRVRRLCRFRNAGVLRRVENQAAC